MSIYKKLFQQTFIYGIAAVIPKVIGFILVPIHISLTSDENVYGSYSILFTWIMFFNALLSFGMETAFFRFYNKEDDKQKVVNNSLWFVASLAIAFGLITLTAKEYIAAYYELNPVVLQYIIAIIVLDALTVIPFAKLRADQRPMVYSGIRIANGILNALFTVLFLKTVPEYVAQNPDSFLNSYFVRDFQVGYLFLANLLASSFMFLAISNVYRSLKWTFDWKLNKEMAAYAFPVLIASLAFTINESFDKLFIEYLLPDEIAKAEAGRYAACYKIGIFMILFRMAYTLGIEPFFFSYAKNEDATTKYATVTKYFVLFGSLAMLAIVILADVLKVYLVTKSSYWSAMEIVPYVILANFLLGIYTNLSVWYKLQDKTKMGAYISVFGAVLTFIFNYLLIPRLGILGAAITTLIAYATMMVISYVLGQRSYPIPYDKKSIGLYLGLSTLFSFVHFYFFRENYWVGTLLFISFFLVVVYKEKALIRRLSGIRK